MFKVMATNNEGFVEDEDLKGEKEKEEEPPTNKPPTKSIKEIVEDIFDVEIDYSKARKAPLFIATISGNS